MSAVEATPDEEVSRPTAPTTHSLKNCQNAGSKSSNSKGLLLRLFQSDLFTSTQAVYYLYKYAAEPGIQFYLCERLKLMPHDEIEFLLPQIW